MIKSDDTKQMLRAIINGQSSFRQEVLSKIDKLDKKVDGLDNKIDRVEKNLAERIDKLGKQLAYLEDDTPTREEFDDLEKRVRRLEPKTASAI